jgi:SagB-type dehydrogenase family enzyme
MTIPGNENPADTDSKGFAHMTEYIRDLIEKTKSHSMSISPQEEKTVLQPPLELPVPPGACLIHLPKPSEFSIADITLKSAVENRRTHRKYSTEPLALEELSYLLWMTQGIKTVTNRPVTLRNVPSAGARHAFETNLLINQVQDVEPGLYRFAAGQHAIFKLDTPGDIRQDFTHATYDQSQVFNSAVTFAWIAVSERMTWRYVERGFRYLLLDAGHVCQNLYLAAEAIHCGVCAIAAFDDDEADRVMGLDGVNLWTVYMASVGKRVLATEA